MKEMMSYIFNKNISQFKYFFSYYFFRTYFFFQETYSILLHKKYGNNPSIHPKLNMNLWLEIGFINKHDIN